MMNLNTIIDSVRIFSAIDPSMPMGRALVFLLLAKNGAMAQRDIEKALGMSSSAASRHISYWSDIKPDGVTQGVGYIRRITDPHNSSAYICELTPQGHNMLEMWQSIYSKGSTDEENNGSTGKPAMAS